MNKLIKINSSDNVMVAICDLSAHQTIEGIYLLDDIPSGHKVAMKDIQENENIIKYGNPIGHATKEIKAGEHIHSHNCRTNLSNTISYDYNPQPISQKKFNYINSISGYHRKNGSVGIRNELWIVVSVGCVNSIANIMIQKFKNKHPEFPVNFDGIYAITHSYGCSQLEDDHNYTKEILQDIVKHPNAGGVLFLGLGCENNQVDIFESTLGNYDTKRVKFLIAQELDDEIESGLQLLEILYQTMLNDKRETCSFSDITIGLKCGGSDGFSGISANPLLGAFSDAFIQLGGSTILTEVPEMFGGEHLLMNRSKDSNVFHDIVHMINRFKNYFINHSVEIYENPSPGNKKGGITTLEEKSLGCIQKSGSSKINSVIDYGEPVHEKGLSLLYGPGNDLVATTALGCSGAQLVLFTTGRGTPFGSFIPTMKISSNSEIKNKKPKWIDFDTGVLLYDQTLEDLTYQFLDYVCSIINGEKVQSEMFMDREIAIFKQGVTL